MGSPRKLARTTRSAADTFRRSYCVCGTLSPVTSWCSQGLSLSTVRETSQDLGSDPLVLYLYSAAPLTLDWLSMTNIRAPE